MADIPSAGSRGENSITYFAIRQTTITFFSTVPTPVFSTQYLIVPTTQLAGVPAMRPSAAGIIFTLFASAQKKLPAATARSRKRLPGSAPRSSSPNTPFPQGPPPNRHLKKAGRA